MIYLFIIWVSILFPHRAPAFISVTGKRLFHCCSIQTRLPRVQSLATLIKPTWALIKTSVRTNVGLLDQLDWCFVNLTIQHNTMAFRCLFIHSTRWEVQELVGDWCKCFYFNHGLLPFVFDYYPLGFWTRLLCLWEGEKCSVTGYKSKLPTSQHCLD